MKVLVVGSGGREHAICRAVAKSPRVDKIYCAPGNAGIAALAECVPIGAMEFDKLVSFAKDNAIDFTIIGMDDPLVGGIVDEFEKAGLKCFGPKKNAAILEGSKAFSKDLMKKYNIPTAAYENFTDAKEALKYLETAKFPIVLKADGLALGKGVLICNTLEEAKEGVRTIMEDKKFGTAVNALNAISPIRTMTASTYQAVSGAGAGGPVELMGEVEALLKGESYQPKVFSHQIAFNLIPQIGGEQFEGYTSEEMKMQNEGRKIMHLPELKVSCTCVRVPVVRSHSISVSLHFDRPVTVAQAREAIANAPGCRLVDDLGSKQYPMPLDTSDQDIVFVGRIRPDLTDPNGLCLWCCGDQVRKGAATNAIQIAELLVK